MATFETKKLASGTLAAVTTTQVLGTVPTGKRWIITAARVALSMPCTSSTRTFSLKAGDLDLFKSALSNGNTLNVPGKDNGIFPDVQMTQDVLQSSQRMWDLGNVSDPYMVNLAQAHNSLCLEAGETIQLVQSGGSGSVTGSYNFSGIEVTL